MTIMCGKIEFFMIQDVIHVVIMVTAVNIHQMIRSMCVNVRLVGLVVFVRKIVDVINTVHVKMEWVFVTVVKVDVYIGQ